MSRRKRRAFTDDYKAEVVELIRRSGKSIGEVARELDLTETSVREWVKRAEENESSSGSSALSNAEREELSALRRQVKTLETEREILKKAAAFFAKESR